MVVESPDGIHPATEAARRHRRTNGPRAVLVRAVPIVGHPGCQGHHRQGAQRRGPRGGRRLPGAVGTIPLALGALEADFAVGGSVKWLCGGPGAGYLDVRPDLVAPAARARTRRMGGAPAPVRLRRRCNRVRRWPRAISERYPNVPTFYSARAGYRLVHEVGLDRIRAHSLALTRRVMDHADARGWRVRTPRADAARGGTVTIDLVSFFVCGFIRFYLRLVRGS